MSPSYLSAYFSSVMKMRIFDYIEQVRVNHARLLLRSTELSVLEVALQSGFRSSSYFNRVFKKIMGMTPGQYRQNKK
ncbi:MAG: helix-turn-helix transcriptional regulator, partial [Lachnospiraceae bacterium]